MSAGLKRVPSFSGRPGFPNGLQVLVVDGDDASSSILEQKLRELSYEVTRCASGADASSLIQGDNLPVDIVLVEAKALAKDATDGGTLRQSAQHLPLVLMSEKGSSTDDVWRGIEVGAADVLEKPLSLLKLRNIWQHVVRKMMSGAVAEGREVPNLDPKVLKRVSSGPSSPRTPSPAASLITISSATDKSKACDEASCSGAAGLKVLEVPEQSESKATAESPVSAHTKIFFGDAPIGGAAAEATKEAARAPGAIAKRSSKRGRVPDTPCSIQSRPPLAIRPPAWSGASCGGSLVTGPMIGMGAPHCYMQTMDPTGCVWGTPTAGAQAPPPGFVPTWGYSQSVPITEAAPSTPSSHSLHKCASMGATSLANSLDSSLTLCNGFSADFLQDDDMLLDDVLLPDEDLLDLAPEEPTMKAPEQPPLGLKLTKSASLVDLINAELNRAQSAPLLMV